MESSFVNRWKKDWSAGLPEQFERRKLMRQKAKEAAVEVKKVIKNRKKASETTKSLLVQQQPRLSRMLSFHPLVYNLHPLISFVLLLLIHFL
ncbi:unnamed protein product [Caenorhabditis nigoni]